MRIALFVDTFPSLSETFIRAHVHTLLEHRCTVFVFPHARQSDSLPADTSRLLEDAALTIHLPASMPATPLRRRLACLPLIASLFVRHPLRTIRALLAWPHFRQTNALQFLTAAAPLIRTTFDLAHAHFGPNGYRALLLKRIQSHVPVVTMFHGYGIRTHLHDGPQYYHRLFQHGDFFLANSSDTAQHLRDFGLPLEKLERLPVGVDLQQFPPVPSDRRTPHPPAILITVARLSEEKALHVILHALAHLRHTCPDAAWQYRLIGDGPRKDSLHQLAHELHLDDRVTFLGPLSHEQTLHELTHAHLFLFSSRHEGLGLALLEAQAASLPVLATRAGGIPEAVLPDQSALLVPPDDPNALAQKLRYLLQNPNLWPQMGQTGRRFVEANYDIRTLNNRLLQLYRELIDRKHP